MTRRILFYRYPAVVDMSYAASAPLRFYAQQQADEFGYYKVITKSAERAVPGCADAVRKSMNMVTKTSDADLIKSLGICTPLPPYLANGNDQNATLLSEILMIASTTFAGLNMENYPPTDATGLAKACKVFVETPGLAAVKNLINPPSAATAPATAPANAPAPAPTCFDIAAQLPAGNDATFACGDWSGKIYALQKPSSSNAPISSHVMQSLAKPTNCSQR